MKIINIENATIPPEKIKNYLLSLSHPVGRFKAIYFNKLGYSLDNWEVLSDAFISILKNNKANRSVKAAYGVKYEVIGEIIGKENKTHKIITVWIISRKGVRSCFLPFIHLNRIQTSMRVGLSLSHYKKG